MSIAVGPEDTLYVADTLNHCVRTITAGGLVKTLAGGPSRPGSIDGPVSIASFNRPVGIAVDAAGGVYVADSKLTGIRHISPDGEVSTLPLPIKNPLAVALAKANATPTLWVTNVEGLWRIDLATLKKGNLAAAISRFPSGSIRYPLSPPTPGVETLNVHGQREIGYPYSVSTIDEPGVVFTDVVSHTVLYVNQNTLDLEPIGGRRINDAAKLGGGFEDGTSDESRFDSPMGIAARADGVVAVADSGNKRIRLIRNIDRRQPFYPSVGTLPDVQFERNDYRIALVGPSTIWGDGLFGDSVGGQLERALSKEPSLIALHKNPRVLPVRMGSSFAAMRSYIDFLIEARFVDAIVVQLSGFTIRDSYGVSLEAEPLHAAADMWQPRLKADLLSLQRSVESAHVPILFVLHPLSHEMGLAEQTLPGMLDYFDQRQNPDGTREKLMTEPFERSGVNWLNAWQIFYADERSPQHRPIYLSLDGHFTTYGNALLGKAIAERLIHDRPWLH